MSKHTIVLGQIDHRTFKLGETRIVNIPPATEQLVITPTENEQLFQGDYDKMFDKVVVKAIPANYLNIETPANVYNGELEVEDND